MKLESMEFEFADVRKKGEKPFERISVSIDIPNVALAAGMLKVYFVHSVSYPPNDSVLRLGGFANFSGPEVKQAHAEWAKTKRLPQLLAEQIVNMINYSASVNSIFIARVFNLTPPFSPPTLRLPEKTARGVPEKSQKAKK